MRTRTKIALAALATPPCLFLTLLLWNQLRPLPPLPQPAGVVEKEETKAWARIPVAGTACFVQNNVWNTRSGNSLQQSVFQENLQGREVAGWRWRARGNFLPAVLSQPQVVCGDKPWDQPLHLDSNFPFRAGSRKLTADFDVQLRANGIYNMTFSLWGVSTVPASCDVITHEIMIWTARSWLSPAGKKIGSLDVNGATWDVYLEPGHADASGSTKQTWTYIAFVAHRPVVRGPLELTAFTDWMLRHHLLTRDHYLTSVEFGNEVSSGTGIVELRRFQLHFD